MADKTAGPLVPAAIILGVLILLPVVLIILGFDLVPLMAITAWSRAAWLTALAALAVLVIAAFALTRSRDRA